MAVTIDPGLKIVSKQLSNIEQATVEERSAEREAVEWLRWCAIALWILALLSVMTALYFGKMVAMPVTAGIVAGLILGPIGDRGKNYGIPTGVTFTLLSLGIGLTVYAIFLILLPVAHQISAEMPQIARRVSELSWKVDSWMSAFRDIRAANIAPGPAADAEPTNVVEVATKAVEIVTPAISQFFIFIFTVVLFFASRVEIRQGIARAGQNREQRLAALKTFSTIENQLATYFFTIAAINFGLAATVGIAFLLLGVPGAATWAIAAFMLNFMPVVGPLLIKASLVLYGLFFAPTFFDGIMPIALYLGISLIEANLITPKIVGDRITMNPLFVFISVVFWTWMWGFAGAFLAMPLLAIAAVVNAHYGRKSEPVSLPR